MSLARDIRSLMGMPPPEPSDPPNARPSQVVWLPVSAPEIELSLATRHIPPHFSGWLVSVIRLRTINRKVISAQVLVLTIARISRDFLLHVALAMCLRPIEIKNRSMRGL